MEGRSLKVIIDTEVGNSNVCTDSEYAGFMEHKWYGIVEETKQKRQIWVRLCKAINASVMLV